MTEIYNLPNGSQTLDFDEYTQAWGDLSFLYALMNDYVLVDFDPKVMFREIGGREIVTMTVEQLKQYNDENRR